MWAGFGIHCLVLVSTECELQALVYDILPSEEGAGKRCWAGVRIECTCAFFVCLLLLLVILIQYSCFLFLLFVFVVDCH